MTRQREKIKKALVLIVEILLLILAITLNPSLPNSTWMWLGSYANLFALSSICLGGIPVLVSTIKALLQRDLTADLLFLLALGATLYLGRNILITGATLILMMGTGELIEEWTIERTYKYSGDLLHLQPNIALVLTDSGVIEKDVEAIKIGDRVLIRNGDRVPLDGEIVEGHAEIDCSLVTGEDEPAFFSEGSKVLAGMLVIDGAISIRVTAEKNESFLSRVTQLIESARMKKARLQTITDKWAQFFAPIVISVAIIVWLFTNNLFYTISVLLVACPCSLVISVPTAFIGALGNAAKHGIWIKSGQVVEKSGIVNMLVLDKTGTLTFGKLELEEIINLSDLEMKKIKQIIYSMEIHSNHPIGISIIKELKDEMLTVELLKIKNFKNLPGLGITADVGDFGKMHFGNRHFMEKIGLNLDYVVIHETRFPLKSGGYTLFLANNSKILAIVLFIDKIREGIRETVEQIRKMNINHVVLLTGDDDRKAREIGNYIGADLIQSRMLPEDKLEFIKEAKKHEAIIAMAGDGINDAPALAMADVGIAIGKDAAALAAEHADAILMTEDFQKIPYLFKLGKKCVNKAKTNIVIAVCLNFLGIVLSAVGMFGSFLWLASLYHVIQSLIVVGNSALILRPLKMG